MADHDLKTQEKSTAASLKSESKSEPLSAKLEPPQGHSRSLSDRLPPWVSANLRSPRSRKMLFRCWLACWASFLILLPNRSLQTLGSVSFFGLLTALFLPPIIACSAVPLCILSTLMVGILLGWGIGAAAMKAAFVARNSALLNSQLQRAQLAASKSPNPQAAMADAIYHGAFLDIRSSAIYGCFIAIGGFIFGLMRAYSPKLIFMSIFGTIAVDIFCVIGPLLPTLRYTILNSVLISVSCYAAIAVLVTIFVFPETMNHSCLFATSQLLEKISGLMMLQDDVLDSNPEELVKGNALLDVLGSKRANIVDALQQLMATSGFINLEFSRGKWNGDDVRALEEPLLMVVSRAAFLSGFARLAGRCSNATYGATAAPTSTEEEDEPISETSSATLPPESKTTPDSYLIRQMYARNQDAEKAQNLHTRDLFPILKECTADLRRVCADGIRCAKAAVVNVNDHRWRSNTEEDEKVQTELQNAIALLSTTLQEFKDTKRLAIVGPYEELIKNARTPEEQESLPLRPLYLAFVFAGNLTVLSDGTLTLLELIRDTRSKRKENRLWAPKGLRALGKLLTARGDKQDGAFGDDGAPSYERSEDDLRSYRRDPDSRPPTNAIQRAMDRIHKLWIWTKTAEARFTFKYVIISVALWIPSVCRRSAHFYYVEKGVWALIMAQTALNIYAGDQIFNLVTRLIGTLIGLVTALLAWYIGNGSSNGNPYGTAAAVGVLLVPTVFVRMFAPPQYLTGVILYCATFALAVGYSWIDGHLPQYSTPGIGWSVAWRRWTLVVVGAAASFIVMMCPPISGRKAVRMGNSSTIVGITNVYNFVTSAWISTQFRGKAEPHALWIVSFRAKIIALTQQVQSIQQLTELAKWEGNIRGHWPYDEYVHLGEVQLEMTAALAQLGGALSHLEDNWRLTFLHNTKALNPNFIADVMSIFSLISQSLRTGAPIPQVLPHPLLQRLLYHHHHSHIATPEAHKDDLLDIDKVKTLDYMYYATGLVAIFQLLQSLDELHQITKRLCGEVPLKGFDRWRHEYGRLHEEV